MRDSYTIGHLYIDYENGETHLFCDTLEDKVRIPFIKVKGETAIPAGKYIMVLDFSVRFQREMPHILDVPGFEGIRIHKGNTIEDTEGCILLGQNKVKGGLVKSAITFDAFFNLVRSTDQDKFEFIVQ